MMEYDINRFEFVKTQKKKKKKKKTNTTSGVEITASCQQKLTEKIG